MYNDTKNRKWKEAMKAHMILKALQHAQNKVLHSHPSSKPFKKSLNCCALLALLKDTSNLFHIHTPSY